MRSRNAAHLFFSPAQALQRLEKMGDLFAPVLKLKQRLPKQFLETPNPAPATKTLTRYAARQLHYDFRLEMGDVLKSWAVPKGIPLVKGEKRAAFATEDHPVAPQSQYGGGTVMVWDIGTYDVTQGNYDQGSLKIVLKGHKLRGEWTLKRLKSDSPKDDKIVWLLIKTGSDAVPIPRKSIDASSLTRRSLNQIVRDKSAVWQSSRTGKIPGVKKRIRPSPKSK